MTVTSGRTLLASLELCGPVSSSLRTLVASSAWRSTRCLLTWKLKVTPAGRRYCQLAVSMPRTAGIESGLWPTPTVATAEGGQNPDTGGQSGLRYAALSSLGLWPTPRERDSHPEGLQAGQNHLDKWSSCTLPTAVLLHTPTQKANQGSPSMAERDPGSWFLPTPDGVNRKSSTALHGTGPRTGRGEEALHASAPGLEQAVELMAGILPKEYDSEEQLSPAARKFLPTPRAIYGEHPGMTDPKHLTRAAMLPTPRHEGHDAVPHRGQPDSLHSYVKMIGTPTAAMKHRSQEHGDGRSPNPKEIANATGMKLNPDWVCRMQGFPDNWLNVD